MNANFLKKITRVTLLLSICVIVSSGCSNKLTVKGVYPTPLIQSLPYTVGVHYDQSFSNYQYVEKSKERSDWIINTGAAQTKLFSTILPAMFDRVVLLDTLKNNEVLKDVDLVISPSITDFQYNLPTETKFKMYEVWMKFNVRVFDSDGELIADWILTAYGKTPSVSLQTNETALNQAVNVALRDAGASLSLTFTRVPEIRTWLESRQQSLISEPSDE